MKKYILLIPTLLVPYSIVFAMYCMFTGSLMESFFQDNELVFLLCILFIWIAAFICDIIFLIASIRKQWDPFQLALVNMLIKLMQIPAYVFIFLLGAACMITIFTFFVSIILFLLDCMSVFLSGIIGVVAIKGNKNCLTKKAMVLHGILHFLFCVDVVSAIVVFRRSAKSRKNAMSLS